MIRKGNRKTKQAKVEMIQEDEQIEQEIAESYGLRGRRRVLIVRSAALHIGLQFLHKRTVPVEKCIDLFSDDLNDGIC